MIYLYKLQNKTYRTIDLTHKGWKDNISHSQMARVHITAPLPSLSQNKYTKRQFDTQT